MRVSIITVCLNAAKTICLALDSVAAQQGVECEHIVVDGGSTDGTVELVKTRDSRLATLVSEVDLGIYDAINKGLKLATGDVIGILNADDSLAHENVITRVLEILSDEKLNGCYSDLLYFDKDNPDEIVRYFRSN